MSEANAAQVAANVREIRERIDAAARQAGRQVSEVTLVAVSKTVAADDIRAAVKAGVTDFGESRVQEAIGKIDSLGPVARWHLIGHLQTNKAARAARYFDMIQSVDSTALAEMLAREAVRLTKTIDCLLEVNSSGEATKFGLAPDAVLPTALRIAGLSGLNLCGIMTIGPWTDDEDRIKDAFDRTRSLFERLRAELGPHVTTLSMGMSSDYELAVRRGSTMVRVGTAIFGAR